MDNVVAPPAGPQTLQPVAARGAATRDCSLDLLELEMALDSAQPAANGFIECVRQVVASLGGAFLFDLPGSGLVDGAQKIAAVQIPAGVGGRIVFVLLNDDGTGVSVTPAEEAAADLSRFAEAVVALNRSLAGAAARPGA